jgi:hypothetical protein
MSTSTKWIASVILAGAMLFSLKSNAQSTSYGEIRFGVGVEAGAPTGNAHNYLSNIEAGATARLQLGLSNNLAVIATSGFYNMFSKNVTVNGVTAKSPGLGIVPVKIGLKGFLGAGIYFTGETGAGFETSRDGNTNQKDTKLILSPGLGYANKHWDVGVRYESLTGQNFNYGLVGLRVAYGFTLKKGDK